MDANTAHPRLIISDDMKSVRHNLCICRVFRSYEGALYERAVFVQVWCGDQPQLLPDNQERYDRIICVLGRETISSGKHYWEVSCSPHKNLPLARLSTSDCRNVVCGIIFEQVNVTGKTDWDLGVARKSATRKGKVTVTPSNGYWFLSLRDKWVRFIPLN